MLVSAVDIACISGRPAADPLSSEVVSTCFFYDRVHALNGRAQVASLLCACTALAPQEIGMKYLSEFSRIQSWAASPAPHTRSAAAHVFRCLVIASSGHKNPLSAGLLDYIRR